MAKRGLQRYWQRLWRQRSKRVDASLAEPFQLCYRRVCLKPITALSNADWQRVSRHFRDAEIAHLNGTPPNLMPVWLLRKMLRNDSRRNDRLSFGIYTKAGYIGTIELYNMTKLKATLGIIIGERSHWGKGYGPEAIHALLHYAFAQKGLELIRLNTYGDNLRAQRAFKRVGFVERRRERTAKGRESIIMELYASAYWQLLDNPPVWHSHHQ